MPVKSEPKKDVHDELMATLKRRGYLQPSYEIYGGVAGFYDYGPLGAGLKTNLENLWRRFYVLGEGMAEIQCPTVSPEQVFRASGHLEKFADTVVDSPGWEQGVRGDHLVRGEWKRMLDAARPVLVKEGFQGFLEKLETKVEAIRESADRDPAPENLRALLDGSHALWDPKQPGGWEGTLSQGGAGRATGASARSAGAEHVDVSVYPTGIRVVKGDKVLLEERICMPGTSTPLDPEKMEVTAFNLMFRSSVGPGKGRVAYMRPETAQGMFMDFNWLYRFFREKLPFGATQVGKAYRNEISPRQSLLRLREFHQMEAEVFFDPEDKTWSAFARLQDKELNLLPREESDVRPMRMGEAVDKGIIANGALGYFIALTAEFLEAAGVPREVVRFRQHGVKEKAHYSTDTWDAEFLSPRFGWVEIVGIADRTDYDLNAHMRVSGQKLMALRRFAEPREVEVNRYVPNPTKLGPVYKGRAKAISEALRDMEAPDEAPDELRLDLSDGQVTLTSDFYRVEKRVERVEGEWYVPHVVEPSYGIDRIFYAVLETAWRDAGAADAGGKEWTSLKLATPVAPVKCGVFPLMAKDGMDELALDIDRELRMGGVMSQYDDGGAIGRRYARQDEIGTPYCVTVDYDTKTDGTVTLRERDTGHQKRVPRAGLLPLLRALVDGTTTFAEIDAPSVQ